MSTTKRKSSVKRRRPHKRSPSADNTTITDTNLHNRIANLFFGSLRIDSTESSAHDIASGIEQSLFEKHNFNCRGKAYLDQARSLAFNLSKNADLRKQLRDGSLTCTDLVNKEANEMASDDVRRKRDEFHRLAVLECQLQLHSEQHTTDQFKCGRCQKRETTYYQMQTRSADEPMTTFVTCVNCNHRWKC